LPVGDEADEGRILGAGAVAALKGPAVALAADDVHTVGTLALGGGRDRRLEVLVEALRGDDAVLLHPGVRLGERGSGHEERGDGDQASHQGSRTDQLQAG